MQNGICETRFCTGCRACALSCPEDAIQMAVNSEGFLYPRINADICTDCGICARVCPVNGAVSAKAIGQILPPDKPHKAYAAYSRDAGIRLDSSSGGVFSLLAQKTMEKGGFVFGAVFDEEFYVKQMGTEKPEELSRLRRSKYVQSDTGNTYAEVKNLIAEGREVLYCGTPCQIAGLKSYLGKKHEGLLSCDLVCSGVPSPKVWKLYLDFLCNKYESRAASVSFRDKSEGWSNLKMKVQFENGTEYIEKTKRDPFFLGFGRNLFIRKSCFNCLFRLENTMSDITLADFWGISKLKDGDYSDDAGVSLVIANTQRGEDALSEIAKGLRFREAPLDMALKYNPRLVTSAREPDERTEFFNDMESGWGFDALIGKYMDNESFKAKTKIRLRESLVRIGLYDLLLRIRKRL